MEPNRIDLTIGSKLEDVFLAGLLVNSACRYAGLDEVEAYRMELCVVEAMNNAIRHAYHGQPGHRVAVSLELHSDRLEFSVSDSGEPIPPAELAKLRREAAGAESFSSDELLENGMGLLIMLEVMDEVNYDSSGGVNTLRLTKRTPSLTLSS
jgi:serine/threonine-protein kinase RsbW